MTSTGAVWIGADPGGKGKFGVCVLDWAGTAFTCAVSSADEAVAEIARRVDGVLAGAGVDAPLWWSSGAGGGRRADQWLRDRYGLPGGEVQSANSLQGAALLQAAMFVQRIRERFGDVPVTESHPKALLRALALDGSGFQGRFGITGVSRTEDERDAMVSAVVAREGFTGRWTHDLSQDRYPSEQDPSQYWLAPVHYWWPER